MSGVGLAEVPTEPSPGAPAGSRTGERFRPDLEGLRAIAVLLVLLYHAGVPGFGGGYVGVDVFFVLSGFLITGLIVRELSDTGHRLARLVLRPTRTTPAARRRGRPRGDLIAAAICSRRCGCRTWPPTAPRPALYASNIRFALLATDYLQADLAPSPLLHYWSLGVEEQFYLFWPALLLLVTRLGGRSTLGSPR